MNYPDILAKIGVPAGSAKGKVVVVSGGGRGIGKEICRVFAYLGARVVIAEMADSGGEVETLIQQEGGQALWVRCDISSQQEVCRLYEKTHATFGSPDVLVNNAIQCPAVPVLDMDVELWDRVMEVNLRGPFLMCQAALPDMLAKGSGVIVNMISTDAMPFIAAYIASKQGLAAFSQSLAAEIDESGVRVIAFAPGFVNTPGLQGAGETLAPRLGLTLEQFLNLSLHPGYEGSMPVEHAALATAWLVLEKADAYHGEQVDGYTLLEEMGIIRKAGVSSRPEDDAVHHGELDPAAAQASIRLAGKQLRESLVETEAEFTRLPIFIRPMARQGFKRKAGLGIQEWLQLVDHLCQDGGETGDARIPADLADQMVVLLPRLAVYFRETPAEMARFTRDEELLLAAQKLAEQRTRQVSLLAELLKKHLS